MVAWFRAAGCAAGLALWAGALRADSLPLPPCGAPAVPAPAALAAAPAVQVEAKRNADSRWTPPACTGWHADGFRMLVALSGRFRLVGGANAALARFGAVSHLTGLRYWSVSTNQWQPLVTEAHALDGPRGAQRPDFSPAELRAGPQFSSETGSFTSGAVIYRVEVREATDARLVITVENVTPMRRLMIDLFDPGELQSLYVLEREADDIWTYYSLTLTEGHDASYANRALALFQHYAGGAGAAALPVAWWR
jgi:hypothetical protein